MKRLIAILVILPAAWACTLVRAHADALTLEEAVALGRMRAPQLQARAAAIDAAQEEAIAAGRLPDPQLTLGIDNLPASGADAWSLGRDFMTMRKVGLMQQFPSERQRTAERQRAAANVALAQSEAQQTELQIATATAQAWIDAYATELVLEKLRMLEPEVELQAQAARTALANARGSTVDALAAQSAVSELNDRILEAQSERDAARARLARWIGEDAQRGLAAAPEFRELTIPREVLLGSVHQHARLLTFDAQTVLAESEMNVARAEKRPDWSAQLAYADRGSQFSDMVSLEFRIGLPLFGRYRQDPVIRAKRAALRRLESERQAELRMHAAEVASVLAAWDAVRERVDLYERERLPLARQRSQAALAGFQAGRVDLAALLQSHAAEIEIQRSYIELIRELGQAWAFLRFLEPEQLVP